MSDYIYFYVYLTKKLNIIKYYKNMDFEKDTATKDFLSLIEIIIIGITALAVYNIILKCILTILRIYYTSYGLFVVLIELGDFINQVYA